MKEHRHPHPHIDPRQPRNHTRPGTNPPVFAWKPTEAGSPYRLQVARDAAFSELCIDAADLADPVHLPERALAPGQYFWRWFAPDAESDAFTFEIAPDAVTLEVPPVAEWLRRFPSGHPRLFVRSEDVPALRKSRNDALWCELEAQADALLDQPHDIAEPPYLPDRSKGYAEWFHAFATILWESRRFVRGAETLALAYLVSGDARYARPACQRLASMSLWDPEGSSCLAHNDEAHMPIIWHGPTAADWVWDQFTDDERERVAAHLRRRGQITFEHMHGRGSYGVTRFDSHAGREIVFLAQVALLIHDDAPEAAEWLEWLRPVLCGIWPVWAGDDGGWAEGPSYGLAYVNIMTRFATALKRGAGIDLYRRPFWRGHARWRQWCWPPYAQWIGFGDHTERWESNWTSNADLVEIIGRETATSEFDAYVAALRDEAEQCPTSPKRQMPGPNPQRFLAPTAEPEPWSDGDGMLRVFPAAGWAAVRTQRDDPSQDVALIFRSSPFGAISHSHANNNDFIIHVGGQVMAMPSGYYDGYGSPHHQHWVWQTKSHNCLTLSDTGQRDRSHESRGSVDNAFEDERLCYFRGTADASYPDRAQRCRRHVLWLKAAQCFVMIDEFVAQPGAASAVQWNMHSWSQFEVDEAAHTFALARGGSGLAGQFIWHNEAFFSLTEGWDPPPMKEKDWSQWHQQYHLRFTPVGMTTRLNLGVVLCPSHRALARAEVESERAGNVEAARVADALVMVNQGGAMDYAGHQSDALALVVVGGERYEVREGGVRGA